MRFAYTRTGGPLLDWSGPTPPSQSRAGETRSLGDFYATTRNSSSLHRYGGRSAGHGGSAVGYEHNRALGDFYPTTRTSNAIRQYGGQSAGHGGSAVGYEHNRALGSLGADDVPRAGAPEIISGYESPAPGDALVHLGGYIPEGAARTYGSQMLGADAPAPAPKPFDRGLIRKAAVLAAAYHGVKRNHGSIFWGVIWAAAAFVSPFNGLLVPLLGVAQGFGQSKLKGNPARIKGGARTRRRHRIHVRRRRQGYYKSKNVRNRKRRHQRRVARLGAARRARARRNWTSPYAEPPSPYARGHSDGYKGLSQQSVGHIYLEGYRSGKRARERG